MPRRCGSGAAGQVRHPKGAKGVDGDPVPASLSRHGLERPETMEVELLSADRCSVVRPPDKRAPFRPLYDVLARHSGPELTLTVATIERHLGTRLPAASRNAGWWLSEVAGTPAAVAAWRAAGFLAEFQPKEKSVRFRRTARSGA